MALDDVKIIGRWTSPYVLRAQIALNLKGVGYELLEEEFGKKSELLLKSNPVYKKIPVLLHGGKPVCESMIIVRYIDEVWAQNGSAILPEEPCERAIHQFWAVFIDDKWFTSIRDIAFRRLDTEEARAEAIEQACHGLKLLEGAFEKCSSGGEKPFFGSDTIGYLDISLGSCLGWLRAAERLLENRKLLDEEETPLLLRWAERFCSHEAVKEIMPATEKLVEFTNMVMARRN